MIELTPAMQNFIVHWGEMGTKWGINRTVAQIHALLCLTEDPLTAEDITTQLKVARSNVSTSLNELQNWGVIKTVHQLGDRRDFFESNQDVWTMFRIILDERKKREIDPTLAVLRDCAGQIKKTSQANDYTGKRVEEFLGFFETMTAWYDRVQIMPLEKIIGLANLPGKLLKAFKRS